MKNISSKKTLFILLLIIISYYLYLNTNILVHAQEKPSISGDIFSQKNISGISVDPGSVITAGGTIIGIDAAIWQIPSYSGSDLIKLAKFMNKMNTNITRLEKEYAKPIDVSQLANGGDIYLNTKNNDITTQDNNINYKPEGQVWYINGSVAIDNELIVHGIGTIIIKNGDLNINANIHYSWDVDEKSSIGFIVKNGNLFVGKKVSNLRGAYYVPSTNEQNGKISFPLVGETLWDRWYIGLFIGGNITFR